MSATLLVPVDVYRDPELGTWHFSVDNPAIVGGGQSSKEEAMNDQADAVSSHMRAAHAWTQKALLVGSRCRE